MEVKTVLCKIVRCVALFSVIIASVFIILSIMKDMQIFDIDYKDTPSAYKLTDEEKLFILESIESN